MEDKNVVAGEKEKARLAEEKVYSIETMIKDWANEKATAEKTKTECIWVDLDYDKPETKNKKNQSRYRVDEKFKQQVGDIINLAGATALEKKKLNDKEETLTNNMDSPTHLTTTCILEVTRNLTYTLSCGLKLSANFKANAVFAEVQAGIELDLGVTREKGKQVKSSVEHKIERTVPGRHENVCTVEAYGTPYKHEFTVAVELKGMVPMLFKNHVNYKDYKISKLAKNDGGHKLQFIPIADIFQDLKTHNKLPKDLTCTLENGKVTCVIKGEYIVEKVTTKIVMEQEKPLAGATVAIQPANTNQSQENKPLTNPANNPSGLFSSRTKDIGIRMPESLALHPEYQKTIQEKIRLTPTQVDEIIKLINLLENPKLKGQEEFIKMQITKLSDGQVDPNYKAQLDWIKENPDKVHLLPSKTELEKERVAVDIYQTTTNNTNQNNNQAEENNSSTANENKPTGP